VTLLIDLSRLEFVVPASKPRVEYREACWAPLACDIRGVKVREALEDAPFIYLITTKLFE
jgi:hypothetical protein